MSPDKKITIYGKKIEQYYWGGKIVVYVDNLAFEGSFDEAIKAAKNGVEV